MGVVGGLPAASAPRRSGPAGRGPRPRRCKAAAWGDRIGELVPFALEHGVRLVLEPLHPMFAADRAVLSTLKQAAGPGRTIFRRPRWASSSTTYHVWWDPELEAQIARAGAEGRLASYQVGDWTLPPAAGPLLSRGYMGDGYVDFAMIGRWMTAARYTGDVEVEIFNQRIWDTPGRVLATITERYVQHVLPSLTL